MKSVLDVVWEQKPVKETYIYELKQQLMISDFLAKLLSFRSNSLEEAESFLNPKLKNLLPDPMHLLDMDKAIERTIASINLSERICIFADYDVDGATSSALLKSFFRDIGVEVDIYVPDRIIEGYGPTVNAMQLIKDRGTKLVITVDCGTSSFAAVEHATNIGLDVIVIDHHISIEHVQQAIAVVNPNRLDENSEYKYLAAVGVAFLFIVGLLSKLSDINYFQSRIKPNLMQYLDLVALGTVCDVMPITNLNRALVAQGLKVMIQRKNLGLTQLCDYANISEKLNCYHLGFVIGPRINAGGRVGRSDLGANLLSTTSEELALDYVKELEEHNNERKLIESIVLEEAIALASEQENNSILFIVGNNWHAGVIGIIASRLKDKYNKPVAVIALNDGIGKASCRSIRGVDFGSKIIEAKSHDLILTGGGHAMAGGFTATEEQLPILHEYFKVTFERDIEKLAKHKTSQYEAELTANSINLTLLEEIGRLEPFGNGNYEPMLRFNNLFVVKANIVGQKHIQCLLGTDKVQHSKQQIINAIAFNVVGTPLEEILLSSKAKQISVIGTLKPNHWQGNVKIQLQIKDITV